MSAGVDVGGVEGASVIVSMIVNAGVRVGVGLGLRAYAGVGEAAGSGEVLYNVVIQETVH